MAALAYPDRIGLRRKGDSPRFVLSGGKGAVLDDGDPLANARLIVVTDTDGNPREARIRQAIQISEDVNANTASTPAARINAGRSDRFIKALSSRRVRAPSLIACVMGVRTAPFIPNFPRLSVALITTIHSSVAMNVNLR